MNPVSVEDIERTVEAKSCKDCLGWHKHCHAECCKYLFLNIDPSILDNLGGFINIRLKKELSPSDQWYYKLRGVSYSRGVLRFDKSKIKLVGNRVVYIQNCELLDGNLCKGHPNNKPKMCKMLNEETAKLPLQPFVVTDNCLFKYK
ncbi:MAG: hypothetical protein ACTSU7_00185 [Candidatus Heimdallarchaeaceae archaeon]